MANSVNPDQMLHTVEYDLGHHCLDKRGYQVKIFSYFYMKTETFAMSTCNIFILHANCFWGCVLFSPQTVSLYVLPSVCYVLVCAGVFNKHCLLSISCFVQK